MHIDGTGHTDVGCVRESNEDAFLVRNDLTLYIVADGVGGAAAGEVASRLFVESCEEEFARYSGWNEDYRLLIARCFANANKIVRDYAREHPETSGMGCTAELLTFYKGNYYLGHVGDSRTYLIRNDAISQITKDHSFVQEQIDLGLLKPAEAETHWLRNAINRAVGQEDDLDVDLSSGRTRPGDIFLMCSDGLSDMLDDTALLRLATTNAPLEERTLALIEAAKTHGGRDNVTAVLCEIGKPSVASRFSALLPGLRR